MPDLAIRLSIANPAPSWNPLDDLAMLFHYQFMVHAYEAGTVVAIAAGAIGYFVVLRGSSFAAHALSHIGFAGAAGAVVLGLSPVVGLLAFTLGSGSIIGALGSRLRGRDVTIGIVLAWTLGLGVLFISLYTGYATEAYALLFGEILGISARPPHAIGLGVALALLFTWLGLSIAYFSPHPVSFFITSIAFFTYVAVRLSEPLRRRLI